MTKEEIAEEIVAIYKRKRAASKAKSRIKNRETTRKRRAINRQKIYNKAVEYMGGACLCCGDLLEQHNITFHHLRDKKFIISKALIERSWETIKAELDKCQLLCVICHKNLHAEQRKQ